MAESLWKAISAIFDEQRASSSNLYVHTARTKNTTTHTPASQIYDLESDGCVVTQRAPPNLSIRLGICDDDDGTRPGRVPGGRSRRNREEATDDESREKLYA